METSYKGTNKMITGIVFGVITFWLFAQAIVNVVPAVQEDLGISLGTLNVAISLAALFSGLFIVAAGGLADKVGRKKIAVIGFILSIIGSLCLVLAQGAALLIIGRIIQGVSAACIMPSTIALIKAYFEGADRQRALSFWVNWFLGWFRFCFIRRWRNCNITRLEMDFHFLHYLCSNRFILIERYARK